MEKIILIETSTALCSTALIEDGRITAYREHMKEHAALTAPFVKEMLDEKGLSVKDCDAVCVSMGPGSYTGLRVGVSTAKGLCFGAGKPLMAISSLETLVWQAKDEHLVPEDCRYIIPMIDARRMEVYTAVFTPDGERLGEVEPKIIGSESFAAELAEGKVLFIGDGAGKCEGTITSPNAIFHQCHPKASGLLQPAMKAYKEKQFKDLAYFEPLYVKEFVATVSKKKLF